MNQTPNRYRWEWKGVTFDFYRLCEILNLKSEPQKHAIKKLIRAGQSVKSTTQDIEEAISALERWKEMIKEDEAPIDEIDVRDAVFRSVNEVTGIKIDELAKNDFPIPPQ